MSKIISTTIKEKDIETYNQLRKLLTKTNRSVGTFLIESFEKTKQHQGT
jgi:hypothetical protein